MAWEWRVRVTAGCERHLGRMLPWNGAEMSTVAIH